MRPHDSIIAYLSHIRNLCRPTSRSAPVKLFSGVLLYFHGPRGRIEYSRANNSYFTVLFCLFYVGSWNKKKAVPVLGLFLSLEDGYSRLGHYSLYRLLLVRGTFERGYCLRVIVLFCLGLFFWGRGNISSGCNYVIPVRRYIHMINTWKGRYESCSNIA